MSRQIPFVDHLVLDGEPHLVAQECVRCGARYFERRSGCAACSDGEFRPVVVDREGTLRSFTIVAVGPPGVPVPFVAGIVDCGGTTVQANVVDVEPDPGQLRLGMRVRLVTYVAGSDDEGTEAVAFAFEPTEAAGG